MLERGKRIVGIDPGLQITGYAVIEVGSPGPVVREAGIIRTMEGKTKIALADRLVVLAQSLGEVLDQFSPQVVVVEQLYAHYNHPRTAILMAHARGVIFLEAARRGMPVISYNATRVKKTVTGSGRASKEQMQLTIERELRLAKPPEPPDVADALAVALCHYYEQTLTS